MWQMLKVVYAKWKKISSVCLVTATVQFRYGMVNFLQSTLNVAFVTLEQNDVIKWKHFPRYWLHVFVRGIYRSPVNSPHKGQWRGALMLSLICTWINGWVNNRKAGDLRRNRAHYNVSVMVSALFICSVIYRVQNQLSVPQDILFYGLS